MKHIVALSGGKDSTCMAILLSEKEPRDYIYFCTPTGDELPGMEEHWTKLEKIIGQPIIRLTDDKFKTIYDLIDHFQMLPNWRARWCTRILKIEVAQKFYAKFDSAKIYVGLRYDEAERKGNLLYDANIEQVFPLRKYKFGLRQVNGYLSKHKITIPIRTDCAMCFYQRIGEWWNLWKYHPDYFNKISAKEHEIGHTLLSPGKWGGRWPEKLADLRDEFEKGRIPRCANDHYEMFPEGNEKCRACSL